jgi:hypothetical protein
LHPQNNFCLKWFAFEKNLIFSLPSTGTRYYIIFAGFFFNGTGTVIVFFSCLVSVIDKSTGTGNVNRYSDFFFF